MAHRGVKALALLVAVALLAIGCGSGGDSDGAGGSGGGTPTGDVELPAEVDETTAAAVRYVDELGGEEAFAAVFLALDRGYGVSQVVAADAVLLPDGTIEGVEPEREPYGATDVTAGDTATGTDEESLGGPEVELVAFQAPAQSGGRTSPNADFDATKAGVTGLELTLHQVWQDARQRDMFDDLEGLLLAPPSQAPPDDDEVNRRDALVLIGILILSWRGYSPDQIAAGMATGSIGGPSGSQLCMEIDGEKPRGSMDRFAEYCALVAEQNRPPEGEQSDTALGGIAPGTYQGTVDTTGMFASGTTVTSASITLTVDADGAAVDWTVEWTEDAGSCTNAGTDWWSGSEVTLDTVTSFSISGTRDFRPGGDCEIGEASSSQRTFRFDVEGTTVTSDIGVGIATIDVG